MGILVPEHWEKNISAFLYVWRPKQYTLKSSETSPSTEGFLAALRCFVARRGCPSTLATDNGSNFIGAQKELKHLYNLINTPKMQNDVDHYCTAHHIQWTHTPARSPHFGGLWEAAVKSMKQLFTKIVK